MMPGGAPLRGDLQGGQVQGGGENAVLRCCCVERGLAKGRTCTDTDHPMFSKLSRTLFSFLFLFFRLFLEGTSNFLVHHFCERLILDSLSRLQRLQDCHLTGVRLCLVCLAARTNFACESGMMPTTRHAAGGARLRAANAGDTVGAFVIITPKTTL